MGKYKKYGKWFVLTAGAAGLLLLVLLVGLGVPVWLAFILAVIGAVPGAIALVVAGALAWLELGPEPGEIERAERREQERLGQQFLDRAKQGRPQKRQ